MVKLEVFQRTDNKWAWHIKAANGRVIATDGNQGYENRADCDRMGRLFTDAVNHTTPTDGAIFSLGGVWVGPATTDT